jgi:hypothetical protein
MINSVQTRSVRYLFTGGALAVLASSCAQHRDAARPPDDTTPQASVSRPFWVREANLPEGFPAPGAVGQVIIKDYPAYRMARFAPAAGASVGQDGMFWPLFKHIKRHDIAMTAPVEMSYPPVTATRPEGGAVEKPVSMAFLYGAPTWGAAGPDAGDPRVVVEDVPAMTVLSVGVRGDYSNKRMSKGLALLSGWLSDNPGRFEVAGPPRYLGYNSPMVPGFMRYGEVQLPVRRPAEPAPGSLAKN